MRDGGRTNTGFSTLLFTLVVLLAVTLMVLISYNVIVSHQASVNSTHQAQSAFNAAQAGLSYSSPYLDTNYSTVTDGQVIVITLGDGSSASIQFNFEGSKDLIRAVSTGTSKDMTVTRTTQELLQYQTGASVPFPVAAMARGKLEMRDNSQIISDGGETITAQSGATNSELHDNAKTILDSGISSTPGNLLTDIQQGVDYLLTTSDSDIETDLLGKDIPAFQTVTTESDMGTNAGTPQGTYIYDYNETHFAPYAGSSSYTMTQHNGEAQIKYDTVLGSEANPIVLEVNLSGQYTLPSGTIKNSEFQLRQNAIVYGDVIINGNAHFSSNVKVYGNVIVKGKIHIVDNVLITGAIIAEGEVKLHNNSRVNGVIYSRDRVALYQNGIINGAAFAGEHVKLYHNGRINFDPSLARVDSGSSGVGGYGRVAGSWTDIASN